MTRQPGPWRPGPPPKNNKWAVVVHGAYSPRIVSEMMEKLQPVVLAQAPWLLDEQYAEEFLRYLRSAAIEQLLSNHIFAVAEQKGIGEVPSRTLEQRTAAARLASLQAEKLGLTPRGHAELRRIVAETRSSEQTIQAMANNGRAIYERRVAAGEISARSRGPAPSDALHEIEGPELPADAPSPGNQESETDPGNPEEPLS